MGLEGVTKVDPPNGGGPSDPSTDDCIRAGMYWFGRSDFVAAEAWWQRALVIEPESARARECLRLLARTTAIEAPVELGLRDDGSDHEGDNHDGARNDAFASEELTEPARDPLIPAAASSGNASPRFAPEFALEVVPPSTGAPSPLVGWISVSRSGGARISDDDWNTAIASYVTPDIPDELIESRTQLPPPPDPLDFATAGVVSAERWSRSDMLPWDASPDVTEGGLGVARKALNPWDEGPARTEALTVLQTEDDADALADPTPFPFTMQLERDPVSFEGAHVEPTHNQSIGLTPDITFTEPVEMGYVDTGEVLGVSDPPGVGEEGLLHDAKDRFLLHDFNGALELLERIGPHDRAYDEALSLAAEARGHLLQMYASKLGSFEQIPRILVTSEQMIWLNLDHRSGFVLSQIDGMVSYEDLLTLSGMPRLDAIKILVNLLEEKVIGP